MDTDWLVMSGEGLSASEQQKYMSDDDEDHNIVTVE
jgi:hypothetical protein